MFRQINSGPCRHRKGKGAVPAQRGIAAFTLMEMLAALTVGLLVLGAVYASLATAWRIQTRQAQRERGELAALAALDALTRDLLQVVTVADDEHTALTLESVLPHGMSRLCFATSRADPRHPHPRWHQVERVCWEVRSEDNGLILVRTAQPLSVAQADSVEGLSSPQVRSVHRFTARALERQTWTPAWPAEESAAWPQAIQVTLQLHHAQGATFNAEVFLPAVTRIAD